MEILILRRAAYVFKRNVGVKQVTDQLTVAVVWNPLLTQWLPIHMNFSLERRSAEAQKDLV